MKSIGYASLIFCTLCLISCSKKNEETSSYREPNLSLASSPAASTATVDESNLESVNSNTEQGVYRESFNNPGSTDPLTTLDQNIAQIKETIPFKIDDATTLVNVQRTDKTVNYIYQVNLKGSNLTQSKKGMESKVKQFICKDSLYQKVAELGFVFNYIYHFTDSQEFKISVSKQDCQPNN